MGAKKVLETGEARRTWAESVQGDKRKRKRRTTGRTRTKKEEGEDEEEYTTKENWLEEWAAEEEER